VLWTGAEIVPDLIHAGANVLAVNVGGAIGWWKQARQDGPEIYAYDKFKWTRLVLSLKYSPKKINSSVISQILTK